MDKNILKLFNPADLRKEWRERSFILPHNLKEFQNYTHLHLAHFTSSTLIDDIMKNGLLPSKLSGNQIIDNLESAPDYVYLLSRIDKLYFKRAVKEFGGNGIAVVVEIGIDSLEADKNDLFPQNNSGTQALFNSLSAGQCKHKGKIEPSNILNIYSEAGEIVISEIISEG